MTLPLLVIAIDGATFDYLRPAINAGYAPVLAKTIHNGIATDLKSTMPPISSPAWITFQTGKNPGKLGFSDFSVKQKGSYRTRLVQYKTDHLAIWNHLSMNGRRIGVVCMHLTYPPDPINGFMVSPVYATSDDYYFPSDLKSVIEAKIGCLTYEVSDRVQFYTEPYEEHVRLEKNRLELVKAVWEAGKGQFDFFACGFNVDRAQHYIDNWEQLFACYQLIDEIVTELLKIMEPANVIIISDHGGGPAKGVFKTNQWLAETGYLHYKIDRRTLTQCFLPSRESIASLLDVLRLKKVFGRFSLSSAVEILPPARLSYEQMVDSIDWSKTVAFSPIKEGIYLNVRGREPGGIVCPEDHKVICEEIIQKLKSIVDLDTGHSLNIEAYRKETIYAGEKIDLLPDIIFFTPDYLSSVICTGSVFDRMPGTKVGGHTMNGILIASGDLFDKNKELSEANLIDIPPTILSAMNVAVPADMDGRVLDIFNSTHKTVLEPSVLSRLQLNKAESHDRAEDEEKILLERLKNLGYIE